MSTSGKQGTRQGSSSSVFSSSVPPIGWGIPLGTVLAIAFLLFRMMDISTKSAKVGEGLLGVTLSALSGLMVLHVLSLAMHIVGGRVWPGTVHIIKGFRKALILITLIIVVVVPTVAGMYLRTVAPQRLRAVCNDVVLADEEAADALLSGMNPYTATFDRGAFAAWHGRQEEAHWFRYPYGPAMVLLTAPLQAIVRGVTGWYDNRLLYLLSYCATVVLASLLRRDFEGRLSLVALVGLMPVTGTGPIIGYNDYVPLFWLVACAYMLARGRIGAAGVMLGLAVACKLTAVFAVVPFVAYCLTCPGDPPCQRGTIKKAVITALIAPVVTIALYAPFAVWNLDGLLQAQVGEIARRAANDVFDLGLDNWSSKYLLSAVVSRLAVVGQLQVLPLAAIVALGLTGGWVFVIRQHPAPSHLLSALGTIGLVSLYCSSELRPHHLTFFVLLTMIGWLQGHGSENKGWQDRSLAQELSPNISGEAPPAS